MLKIQEFKTVAQNCTFIPVGFVWSWSGAAQSENHQQACCMLSNLTYRLVATCQHLATNLSISSGWKKSVKIRLVASCGLPICYNLLKQLAASLWITSFDDLLATCKSVDNLQHTCPQQAVASHANAS